MLDENPTVSNSDCYDEFYRNGEVRWTFLVLLTFFILFTIVGNTLVCLALVMDKSLRTPANIFLLNMSVGDIVVTGTIIFTDYVFLIYFPEWALGSWGNWVYNIGFVALLIIPFLTLTAVTIDRYFSIIYPLRYILMVTRQRVVICVFILWGYTITAVTLIAVFSFSKDVKNDYWQFLLLNPYYVTLMLCHTLLPLVAIVVMYVRIYLVAIHHSRQIAAVSKHFSHRGIDVRFIKSELKATRTVLIVVVILVLSWLPMILNETIIFIIPRSHCVFLKLGAVTNYVTYINGALNPIVYALRHRRFFLVYKKIIFCKIDSSGSRRTAVAPRASSLVT